MQTLSAWPDELMHGERLNCGKAARFAAKLRCKKKPVSPSTITRWCRADANGIALPHLRVGGAIVTTEAAMLWYFAELAKAKAFGERCVRIDFDEPDIDAALDAEGL